MKTIKDFIRDKATEIVVDDFSETVDKCPMVEAGIEAGIKEAERWISVEEEMPEGIEILAENTNKTRFVANIQLGQLAKDQIEYFHITHWRTINRK